MNLTPIIGTFCEKRILRASKRWACSKDSFTLSDQTLSQQCAQDPRLTANLDQGPAVQSTVSLTTFLRRQHVKYMLNTLLFALQKILTFFQQKITVYKGRLINSRNSPLIISFLYQITRKLVYK